MVVDTELGNTIFVVSALSWISCWGFTLCTPKLEPYRPGDLLGHMHPPFIVVRVTREGHIAVSIPLSQ